MAVIEKVSLERAKTAESAGVSSKVVQAFVDKCIEEGKELHSIMVLRHGKVACEAYRKPYGPEYKHMMYSVSKSFTSTAIGFAIDEGYFSLDTKFLDIFPEARKSKPDENLEMLTVEDLLTMRGGLQVSPMLDKTKDNWFRGILSSPWYAKPGEQFLYISENMYLLCCIIHKKVGISVMEYLKPRLFEPLGIEDAFWETDPRGIEAGGWGLMIKTEDLAKFTLCYQQHGMFGGRQVIPEWWTVEATKYHADNSVSNVDFDSIKGYGYCFWRNGGYEKSFRADGMFSQFGIAFEDIDACVIITAGEIFEQLMRDIVWQYFPKAFIDDDPNAETTAVSIPEYARPPKKPRSFLEKKLAGRTLKFMKPLLLNLIGYPVSSVTLPALLMEKDKAGNISNVKFEFLENEAVMSWTEGDELNSIRIGMDGEYRQGKIIIGQTPYNTFAAGAWNSETELEIHIRPIETVAERILNFKFDGENVVMRPSSMPTSAVMGESLKETIKDVIKQPLMQKTASNACNTILPKFVDMPHIGKIK